MNHAGMILRTAHVAGILERDPRVTGFENHLQHAFPKVDRRDPFTMQLTGLNLGFVSEVALFEFSAVGLMQIGCFARPKQRPILTSLHPFHEQVRNPVRGVHVVGAPPVVTCVFAQL